MSVTKVDIIRLCDIYGELLTDKQCQMLRLFYDYDNSLSEIAEQYGITRQAVHDTVNKAVELLQDYEKKLCFLEKFSKIEKLANNILDDKDVVTSAKQIIATLGE